MQTERIVVPLVCKSTDEQGTIEGYGSTFGNVDLVRDVMVRGCFEEDLKRHAASSTMPGLYWWHDVNEPVGDWLSMQEDEKGLYVRGRFWVEPGRSTDATKKAWNVACSNGPKGLSIGFIPIDTEIRTVEGVEVRAITKCDLVEVSVVPFPVNPEAVITTAKSVSLRDADGNAVSIRDAESALRDAGLSRKDAKAILARGYHGLASVSQAEEETKAVVAKIDAIIHSLKGKNHAG